MFSLKIFRSKKNRKSIPSAWCGLWTDRNGKQLIIKEVKRQLYSITILDKSGIPFQINLLDNNKKETVNLIGNFTTDTEKRPILQVEAGSDGIGPTYNLYFVTKKSNGKLNLAHNKDDLKELIILPSVGIGLYDDWEDDLGVPWAFPLDEYKKN